MCIAETNTLATYLDVALKLGQLIGIPVAIGLYVYNKRKEKLEREYGTYNALDDKYIDYLKLCLANSDLDVADIPKQGMGNLNRDQQHRETLIFGVLVSILERAYLMYQDKSEKIKDRQWKGWETYIKTWCGRSNFIRYTRDIPGGFDTEFLGYLRRTLSETTSCPTQ